MYFQTSWLKDHPAFIRAIHLRNEELKKFDWKAKAKEHLEAQIIDINLTELIDAYQSKVAGFYEWFQLRQEELHAAEIAKVEDKRAEIRSLVLPDILNAILQFPGLTIVDFEATILPYIGYDEQIVFALMEPGSKADFLLIILKSMANISPTIKRKIREIYQLST